jgi:hypothetical protein
VTRDEVLTQILLKSSEPREFFDRAFRYLKTESPVWSLAYLVKHGGFASRAHVREVLIGKRALTPSALAGLMQAFPLSPAQRDYLMLHFEETELTIGEGTTARENLMRRKQLAAARLAKKTELPDLGIFAEPEWPTVYAALGTTEEGATLSDVRRRTKLPPETCVRILSHLLAHDLVVHQEDLDRFLPRENHLIFEQMAAPEVIRRIFIQSLSEAQAALAADPSPEEALFYSGKVCISRSHMKELQDRLYEMCLKNLNESENPKGDAVATVLVSVFDSGLALGRGVAPRTKC